MYIGIDARSLYRPDLKGIGIYLRNLLFSLSEIDQKHNYILFYDGRQEIEKRLPKGECFSDKNITIRKGDTYYLWEQLRLPIEIKRSRVDIVHCPANTSYLFGHAPRIVTVHDTKCFEEDYDEAVNNFYYKRLQPFALKGARKIICPSEFSKKCILNVLPINESKIEVVYNGISPIFRKVNDSQMSARVKQKYDLNGEFILTVGGETPPKNISGLISAYAHLSKNSGVKQHLVVTGIRNRDVFEKHKNECAKFNIEDKVRILGYVQEDELITLYNEAEVFVYPSLFEGFGFPPLEAMACGTPVAASNATSIPEVVGDAALLFDGKNKEDIAGQIYRCLTDQKLRGDLVQRGFKRVEVFQWRNTAQRMLEIYQDCAK